VWRLMKNKGKNKNLKWNHNLWYFKNKTVNTFCS
jgi:hypothetical protein